MEKQPTKFVTGMRFFKAREGAPEFVKGNIVIEKKEFVEFLNTCMTDTVRIDLLKSKEKGTLYLTLNTFNPMKRDEAKVEKTLDEIAYPQDDINPDDIPFN